jgi:hypothetical protein
MALDSSDKLMYQEVRIIPLSKTKLYVEFDFVRLTLKDPHFGWTHGVATIRGDSAFFTEQLDDEDSLCVIPIKFTKPGELFIEDKYGRWSDCGFGYGVTGYGTYRRFDKGIPELHWYPEYAKAKRVWGK